MKLYKFPILLMAAGCIFTACDNDDEATQPTAAISVDKTAYDVNESMTMRFIGSAENVVVYTGDESHDYELRNENNYGLVVNKGLITYAYPTPGIYHVVCVATNHENAGKDIKSDTTSVWVTVTDHVNEINKLSYNVLNINEVEAEPINDVDWLLAIPRSVKYNGKAVKVNVKSALINVGIPSTSATIEVKPLLDENAQYEAWAAKKKYNLEVPLAIRATSASNISRGYRLYCLRHGEFATFELAGVTGKVDRQEYDYSDYWVNIEVPAGTDITNLKLTYTLNDPDNEKIYIGDRELVARSYVVKDEKKKTEQLFFESEPTDFSSEVTYRFVVKAPSNPDVTLESTCRVNVTVKP